jgi:hypothetical protein
MDRFGVGVDSAHPRSGQVSVGRLFATLLKKWHQADACIFHSGIFKHSLMVS